MNILPLVFAFFVVFVLCIQGIFFRLSLENFTVRGLCKSWRVEEEILRISERHLFKAAPKDPGKKIQEKTTSPMTSYVSFRNRRRFYDRTKLSLKPLNENINSQSSLKISQVFKNLLHILYTPTKLKEELDDRTVEALVKAIILAIKANPNMPSTLAALDLQDPKLQALLYTLCKGSAPSPKKRKGYYPSLDNYVTLSSFEEGKCLLFPSASLPVLRAFLGKEATDKVIAKEEMLWKEKGRHQPLNHKDLFMILKDNLPSQEFSLAQMVLSFKRLPISQEVVQTKELDMMQMVPKHLSSPSTSSGKAGGS